MTTSPPVPAPESTLCSPAVSVGAERAPFLTTVCQRGHDYWQSLVDFLYPPVCCSCLHWLPCVAGEELKRNFCDECLPLLPAAPQNTCLRCGAPIGLYVNSHKGCPHCQKSQISFQAAVAIGAYAEGLKTLCRQAKHKEYRPLAEVLAQRLWERQADRLRSWQCDLVVNVPMHWRARWRREWHPNETTAATLAQNLRIPWQRKILRQTRRIGKQALLAPSARQQNVRGAYGIRSPQKVRGKVVLLVDDILTTTATAQACTQVLLAHGARQVYVATLARGLRH